MPTPNAPIRFSVNSAYYDFAVIETWREHVCSYPLQVVGASRRAQTIHLVPLVEIAARDMIVLADHPRRLRLRIPPDPGVVIFKALAPSPTTTAKNLTVLKACLARMGVTTAFLHTASDGLPDDSHDLACLRDVRTGGQPFRFLPNASPVVDRAGLRLIIEEAYNFMPEVDMERVSGEPAYTEWKTPSNMAAHLRAFAAALDGAARTIRDHNAAALRIAPGRDQVPGGN